MIAFLPPQNGFIFVALTLFVILFWVPRRESNSPTLRLFRALFPSWRFFDRTGEVPRLEARRTQDSTPQWKEVIPPRPRPLTAWVFNPAGNRDFALHTLVGQLVSDLQDTPDATPEAILTTVSYTLVKNLVESRMPMMADGEEYQFRLVALGPDHSTEEFFVSPVETKRATP